MVDDLSDAVCQRRFYSITKQRIAVLVIYCNCDGITLLTDGFGYDRRENQIVFSNLFLLFGHINSLLFQ